MAQGRQRRSHRGPRPVPPPRIDQRRRNLRRVVIAFLVLIGLAGILAVSAPDDDPAGEAPATAGPIAPIG